MKKLAIVITTYKRNELLGKLLESIKAEMPWKTVVVDNDPKGGAENTVLPFKKKMEKEGSEVIYVRQKENIGGAGGFYIGVKTAYKLGAEWFWLMDDDVMILPGALEKLSKWEGKSPMIQPSRLNSDGTPFYWQYRFIVPLSIPNPFAAKDCTPFKSANTCCFEGVLVKRSLVEKIGFPDPRYFIYWDDTTYGYLASKVSNPIVIPDIILQRTRSINNLKLNGNRRLNSTSDLNRYYIMRNRGFLVRYLSLFGDFDPLLFGLGTFFTFLKEIVRIAVLDRRLKAFPPLIKGWIDSMKVMKDKAWKPMFEQNAVRGKTKNERKTA